MICKYETKTFINLLICDDCKHEMVEEEYDFLSNPIKYIYKCPKCGKTKETTKSYPEMFQTLVGNPIETISDNQDTIDFVTNKLNEMGE